MKYEPLRHLVSSLCLHLCVGIMYQENCLCTQLLLPLGSLPVMKTPKTLFRRPYTSLNRLHGY